MCPSIATVDALDRNLVLEFFWTFSVFECALKRNDDFLRTDRVDAQANWEKFGKSIRGRFGDVRLTGFRDAVYALKAKAPQRQIVRDRELAWEKLTPGPRESEEEFVLRLLKTARNNLFHGGKYPDGDIPEVARDKAILQAALRILKGCSELNPQIKRFFEDAIVLETPNRHESD